MVEDVFREANATADWLATSRTASQHLFMSLADSPRQCKVLVKLDAQGLLNFRTISVRE